jgi:autotransporter-associated beta strand protein
MKHRSHSDRLLATSRSCSGARTAIVVAASLALAAIAPHAWGQLPAFPGAQGFGQFATGARGGSVYFVTTTNDTGAGSFRDAVGVANRTIIFRVGGVIDYQPPRYAPKANITIAGQTAPGDGVTIYGNGLSFSGANNDIVRFIRVREGVNGDSGTDAIGIANGHDMIFDHIDSSWGRDETFSINPSSGQTVDNITIQSCIIAQGLQTHSAGGLIQTDGGASILRCLYIDNDTRNPKVKFVNEFVNNVVCNWETIGYNMGGDSAGDSYVNMFDNYFIRGQSSSSTAIGGGNLNFHIYANENWYDGNRNGVLDGALLPFSSYGSMDLQSTPYSYPIATNAYSPLTALKLAISDAGPSFRRDTVDERLITELISWGILGGTITSELLPPMNGPGQVRNGTPYADTDNDGMPDFWENGTGSNPSVANNNDPSPSGSGYTRLEDYLNWLAEPHGIALTNTNVVVDLRQFTRGWVVVNHNPVWSVSSPTNGTVSLINNYFAQFVPNALNGPAAFQFTVNDDDGSPVTRTMNLFFTPAAQSYQPVWHGDDLANNWNTLGDYNWFDGVSLLYQFHANDAVTFDDTGSAAPAVNLVGSIQPASVTVNATKNYTFSGGGSLDGSMGLNKTNTGTLTLNTINNYSGNTIVSNGTVLVNGSLKLSVVSVRSGGSIGGNGNLGSGLTVFPGSSIVPGNGNGFAGTLTVSNTLTLSGSVTNRFDLSDDPTGSVKTNDLVQVVGDLNVSGINIIKINLLDGLAGNGLYTLFTYSGTFNGSLANFVLSGVGGTLTNPPGSIAVLVNATRPPASLVWAGDGANNRWDTGTNVTWLNDGAPDRFYFLDDVLFDDTGSTAPPVSLIGDLTPNSVAVDASVNYTLSGTGKITGTTGLTKTNGGTLTILTTNDFSGQVVVGGGILSVPRLANGQSASPIGAASSDPANLTLSGGTLSYTGGSTTVDRGSTVTGLGGVFDIANSGTILTWNGTNVGDGTLIKRGLGTLTLSAQNSYTGGTIADDGTIALNGPPGGGTVTANNYALGSGSVTFQGGTLTLFGYSGSTSPEYGTFDNPMIVPLGETGTLLTPPRYTMASSLSGAGTLNLTIDYLRGTLSGNWSAFTGTINVTALEANSEFRVANTAGYGGAALVLGDNVVITRSGGATTVDIGSLSGTSGSRIGPGSSTSSGSSYRIGLRNEDTVFNGQILADGVNTVTKAGTGNLKLTGASTYSGGTIINAGTLTVNNIIGSGTGTAAVTVNSGATLAGTGIISGAVTVTSGATLSPGDNGIGTLTVNNTFNLNSGATAVIQINKTSGTKDLLSSSSTLTYGGTLVVTNLGGTLTNGDSFKIFNASSYSGAFTSSNLPPLSPDLRWNTLTLASSGTISVVSTNFTGPQPLTWAGDGLTNTWDVGTSQNWLTTNDVSRAFLNGDSVTFDDSGSSSPPVTLAATVSPALMTVSSAQNYTIGGPGAVTTTPLLKSGSGTLTFTNTGANSFNGVGITGGSLQLGDGANFSLNLSGNVTNSGSLIFANAANLSSSAVIRGSGKLVKNGSGSLTFTASQLYTGPTTINAGTVTFNAIPPPSDITNNSMVMLVPSAGSAYNNSISGTGSVTVSNNTGVTFLTGINSFTGNLTNAAGMLVLTNNRAAGSGQVVYNGGYVVVAAGMVITNDFSVPSSTSDLSLMATNSGTATWSGNIITSGGASWRPGSDGGTLVFTGTAQQGTRNFIVPRGAFQIASNAVVAATGTATAFGRDGTGGNRSASVTIKDNASVTVGECNLGGNNAGGNVTLTIQDNASFSCGVSNLDLQNVNRSTAVTFIRLFGGTTTVGGFTKTKTSQTNVILFSGGVLKAGTNNAAFLPAFSVSTNLVQANGAIIDDGGFAIAIAAPLLHDPGSPTDAGLTKLGSSTLTLSGANTYNGPTTINGGTLALTGSGSVATSTNIYINSGATFDPSTLGSFTLGSGRKLWGNGTFNGSFILGNGSTLAPGSNNIGRLTFNNPVTFAASSTNFLEISKSPLTNDVVKASGNAALNGSLVVTKIAGTLAPGDTFKLIDATTYSGSFSSVTLPTLDSTMAWNTNNLTNGVLSIVSTVAPSIGPVTISGTDLIFTATGGANGPFYLLGSTDLPPGTWTRLLTNQFDTNGNFTFTNSINGSPQVFYRLQLQ